MAKSIPVPRRDEILPVGESSKRALGLSGGTLETVAPKTRRRFPASEKLRIVKAADAARASGERGAVEALLRREGLYGSHLTVWRRQLAADGLTGLANKKPGRKPKLDEKDRLLARAIKENAELKRKLHIAHGLIELQKKVHELFSIPLPTPSENE